MAKKTSQPKTPETSGNAEGNPDDSLNKILEMPEQPKIEPKPEPSKVPEPVINKPVSPEPNAANVEQTKPVIYITIGEEQIDNFKEAISISSDLSLTCNINILPGFLEWGGMDGAHIMCLYAKIKTLTPNTGIIDNSFSINFNDLNKLFKTFKNINEIKLEVDMSNRKFYITPITANKKRVRRNSLSFVQNDIPEMDFESLQKNVIDMLPFRFGITNEILKEAIDGSDVYSGDVIEFSFKNEKLHFKCEMSLGDMDMALEKDELSLCETGPEPLLGTYYANQFLKISQKHAKDPIIIKLGEQMPMYMSMFNINDSICYTILAPRVPEDTAVQYPGEPKTEDKPEEKLS